MNINTNLPGRPNVDCGTRMTTITGRYVDPYHMSPRDIDIMDIAEGLSKCCRFAGQCAGFYSVAQHSVLCAHYVLKKSQDIHLARIALMHDAPEAYMGDLVRCVKSPLADYHDAEYAIWLCVVARFDLHPLTKAVEQGGIADLPHFVREADLRMLVTERRDLINEKSAVWSLEHTHEPYSAPVLAQEWPEARRSFLETFVRLFGDLNLWTTPN